MQLFHFQHSLPIAAGGCVLGKGMEESGRDLRKCAGWENLKMMFIMEHNLT